MTPAQYERVREIFLAARDLGGERRSSFLRHSCSDDAAMRTEVESLLRHESDDAFLRQPALGHRASPGENRAESSGLSPATDTPQLPERIGRYRILGLLGEGGMGVVYRAEQDRPRRVVALKVMKPGFTSKARLRRFEVEFGALQRVVPFVRQFLYRGVEFAGSNNPAQFQLCQRSFINVETLGSDLR